MWAAGCVLSELLLGWPLFKGENTGSQLVEVIQKMGTPNKHELKAMNPDYVFDKKLQKVEPQDFNEVSEHPHLNQPCRVLPPPL